MKFFSHAITGEVHTSEEWAAQGLPTPNPDLIEVVRVGDRWIEANDGRPETPSADVSQQEQPTAAEIQETAAPASESAPQSAPMRFDQESETWVPA